MSLLANVLPGNSPWTGGSLKRVSPPSGGLGSGIAGARNGAGSLLEGVAVSETKRARFNSGSNIRVPYARVVPVSDNTLPTTTGSTDGNKKDKVGETTDLRPMEVAFIRGAGIAESNDLVEQASDNALLPDNGDETASYGGSYKGLHGMMLWVGHGVDRPQRLCTFEYAKRFFEVSLGNVCFRAPEGLGAGTDAFLHSTGAANPKDVMSKLHNEMRNAGLFLWSPDGVVVGKDHTGSEPDWEDIFDTKHGQLFNVAVQGPAVVSTFTGDRKLVSMPGERLFVLVTCDVRLTKQGKQTLGEKKEYLGKTNVYSTSGNYWPYPSGRGQGWLCNFQLRLSSASEMWKHSGAHAGSNRLGLSICPNGGIGDPDCVRSTYVVGGWSLGRVLDSAASRPYTGLYQQKKDLTGHAVNLNVCIEWKTCDELRAAYCPMNGRLASRGW